MSVYHTWRIWTDTEKCRNAVVLETSGWEFFLLKNLDSLFNLRSWLTTLSCLKVSGSMAKQLGVTLKK